MRAAFLISVVFLFSSAFAQNQSSSMAGMDMSHMSGHDQDMHDMSGMNSESDGNAAAMHSMEGHHMDMGPHMKMTTLRSAQPGDQDKADQIVQGARATAEKYKDYKAALADGYKIFMPNVPQKQYHFTNYWNALRARNSFDPSRPTSLLYEKNGTDYKLIGVMYTAQKDANEDELNSRIPLSIAQWHAHVNLCMPPRDRKQEAIPPDAKFGLSGSITTKEDCDIARGKFMPQIFGWMVHIYLEQKPEDIWSVERQHNHMD
ncbi:MAG: hypothetical protein JWN74_3575 [Acidobacteriaceae bacterium]|jgi:hypothetical protein|nr:hypothetical protein [Acidobacteriaceae bacterium]